MIKNFQISLIKTATTSKTDSFTHIHSDISQYNTFINKIINSWRFTLFSDNTTLTPFKRERLPKIYRDLSIYIIRIKLKIISNNSYIVYSYMQNYMIYEKNRVFFIYLFRDDLRTFVIAA